MSNTLLKLFICLIISLTGLSVSQAQLQVELMRQGFFDTHVNVESYPKFSAYLRATENGQPAVLTVKNILIIEDNRSVVPSSISAPNPQNWQKVEWYTSLLSKTDTANGDIDAMQVFVTFNNQMAHASADYRLPSVSIVSFLDIGQNVIRDLDLGTVIPGNSDSKSFKIWPQAARMSRSREQQIAVDSIVVRSNSFRYFDIDGPPFMLTSPFLHHADIIFRPTDMGYKRDDLTLYYDGGRKAVLPLIGNSFKIQKNTFLNLIQPNGGEKLTPCETYEIKWRGNVRGLNTKIEYTTDFGYSWKEIAYVADSTYLWTVPGDVSDNVYMRVSQPLQKDKSNNLIVDDIPVTKVAFDSKGDFLLAANKSGMIYEWNLLNLQVQNNYSIGTVEYPGEISDSKGLIYYDNNTKFVAAYNRYYFYPADNPDTLAFFSVGMNNPLKLMPLKTVVREIISDSKKNFITVVPKYDNKLYLHSFTDGSLIRTVDFDYPIAAANFSRNSDSAVVVLYNNDVILLDVPGFNILKKINFQDMPQIIKAAISPNGKFIGIGCLLPVKTEFTGNRNSMHLIDIESGMIVRTLSIAASNPVSIDFSPTSNIMISGNEGQPQIAFWDLPQNDYSGSIPGNTAILTDMKVSPDGTTVASTSLSYDYLNIKSFTYPETDLSDGTFRILRAEANVDSVLVQPKYLGTDNQIAAKGKFCNKGQVPLIIDYATFFFGKHFTLKTNIKSDTVRPGECLDFEFVYHPLDTGMVRDTLLFYSCSGIFKIPFESYSIPRHITFFSNPLQFGELCIGEQLQKDFLLARNDDPVPLKVNYVTMEETINNPFTVVSSIRDSLIQPGGTFDVSLMFSPQQAGPVSSIMLVNHSDLPAYAFRETVSGTGLGTDIQLSHNDLRFIPEILTRKLVIKNLSDNQISIVQAGIYPGTNFTVVTPLPVVVPARGSAELEILWNGKFDEDDSLHIVAEPCVKRTVVVLGPYAAQSYLTIPDVEADPNSDAIILVKYKTYSNNSYNGKRFFESEISVNPRMFLPLSVTSPFGEGTLLRNDIENDRRIIGFRVEGDFPESGIAAEINGVAGLAETDTSALRFQPGSVNWGTAVQTSWGDGTLRLINLCGDRRIIQGTSVLSAMTISPNPASDRFILSFVSTVEGYGVVDILDNFGNKVMSVTNIKIAKGENSLTINMDSITPGAYTIVIRIGGEFISRQIIVIR